MNETTIESLIKHCLTQVTVSPYGKRGFEHYILLKCLNSMSKEEFERIKKEYKFILEE